MQCGGNDMGTLSVGDLRFAIIATMRQLACKLPQTRLVWLQILPRPHWQQQGKCKEREVGRKRINSAAGKVILLGGCYIKYPDIVIGQPALFLPDGVHLSQIRTVIVLNTLSGALRTFITSSDTVYPKQWWVAKRNKGVCRQYIGVVAPGWCCVAPTPFWWRWTS